MRIRNKGLKNPLIKMVHFNIFLVTTGNMLTMIYFIIYQISKGVTLTGRSALFGTLSHMTIREYSSIMRRWYKTQGGAPILSL